MVKLVLEESGSADLRELQPGITILTAVRLAYVELRAAVAAAHRDGRLSETGYRDVKERIEMLWQGTSVVEVDETLMRDAGELAERHRLRAYDAVQLAGLHRVGTQARCVLACWDADLRRAASDMGYALFPEHR